MKQKLANIFPLLEEGAHSPEFATPISPTVVQGRIEWLQQCKDASQEDFALRWRHLEPSDSFHPTLATVLGANLGAIERLLALEQAVSAKKITAHWAHLKSIYTRYGIDVVKAGNNNALHLIKFPHEEGHGKPVLFGKLDVALAKGAFPNARNKLRYSGVPGPQRVREVAQRALLEGGRKLK